MDSPFVIRGTFANKAFVPEDPLPDVEGRAELIVYARAPEAAPGTRPSIDDLLGKAQRLRSAEDMDAQLDQERAAWGDA